MNLRPSGYEPDELPDCSTPRLKLRIIDTNQKYRLGIFCRVPSVGWQLSKSDFSKPQSLGIALRKSVFA
ncbi:protein of unknown function [Denitratisoma oestradiolicum]|uniref:Uncharacterized protein n=1 Tax=Denitratisoma oestradiolicum TaxID=311182 RepID=A0A6S6Y040_9PROT|nr:protein of unknown function [Denitratisoma oestradiolicum]